MIVSPWDTPDSMRETSVEELQNHMRVDVSGKCDVGNHTHDAARFIWGLKTPLAMTR
jgi:hypothetical protein